MSVEEIVEKAKEYYLENPVLGRTYFLGFKSTGYLSAQELRGVYTGRWGGKYEFHSIMEGGRVFKYTSRPSDPLKWFSDGEDDSAYSAVHRRTEEEITDHKEKQRIYNLVAQLTMPLEAGMI